MEVINMGFKDIYKSKALFRTFVGYLVFTKKTKDLSIKQFAKDLEITEGGALRQLQALVKIGYLRKIGNHKPQLFKPDWDYIANDFLKEYAEIALYDNYKEKMVKINLTKKQFGALKTLLYNYFLKMSWTHPAVGKEEWGSRWEKVASDRTFWIVINDFFTELILTDLKYYSKIKELKALFPVIKEMRKYAPTSSLLFTLELMTTTVAKPD